MGQWLIHFDEKQYSADNPAQIRQWLSEGRIPEHAFIYHPSLGDWVRVTELDEKLTGSPKSPTPAPGPPPKLKKKSSGARQLVGCLVLMFVVVIGGVIMLDSSSTRRSRPSRATPPTPRQSKPAGGPTTTKSGYIACQSKEWLDDVFAFLRNDDRASLGAYLYSGKCIALEDGVQVTVTDWGFATTQFVYQGTKYYAPSEAINR